jgi:hypothetical protein
MFVRMIRVVGLRWYTEFNVSCQLGEHLEGEIDHPLIISDFYVCMSTIYIWKGSFDFFKIFGVESLNPLQDLALQLIDSKLIDLQIIIVEILFVKEECTR